MTHLPYIAASYALGLGVPLTLGLLAWQRLARARRRLAAVDPRGMPR
jgi:cytochrome c biogenesis protein CcdA